MIEPTSIVRNSNISASAYVGDYCVIGAPGENRDTWPDEMHLFGVEIQDGAILAKLVTVDAGTIRNTVIGKRTMLMAHSHAGHDALIGDDCTIACGAKIGGLVEIHRGANIGLNAAIHPRQVIAPYVMIGAGAVVTKNLETKPFCVYAGNPARFLKFNQRAIEKHGLTPEQVTEIQEAWINKNA